LEEIMLGKTVAVLALAASCVVIGVPPSLAGSERSPATVQSGWYDTDSNAAHSRANLAEKVLTPSAVTKAKYLRSVVSPPAPPNAPCGTTGIAAPLPYGGKLYVIANASVRKYNPATGKLIWRHALNSNFVYDSLAISGNLVITAASDCLSNSEPSGIVYALNASTGAVVWKSAPAGNGPADDMTKVGSYVITEGVDAVGVGVSVLNLGDGSPAWSSFCDSGSTPRPSALVVGMLVLSYGCDSQGNNQTLDARNLATGALVWSLPGFWTAQRGDLSGSAGKHLYATNPSGPVVDLNPLTGQVKYSLSQAVNVLAVDASRVYATCGTNGQYVCAYNISTGTLEWEDTQLLSSPALAAEADGVLYLDFGVALNAATGKVIKKFATGYNPPVAALAVGDGRIAVSQQYSRVLDLFGLPGY
jgi:PQQ-like domain